MENYMQRIFDIFALKENQELTTKQIKAKIMEVLYCLKGEVQSSERWKVKKEMLKSFEETLNDL
jgi:hypothetical protein